MKKEKYIPRRANFGDLPANDIFGSGLASPTRGLIKDGSNDDNSISYVTISSTGDSVDYGDLSVSRGTHVQTAASATRGIFAGGNGPAPATPSNNEIQFVTIASLGNSIDFGDVSTASEFLTAASSSTRCVWHINAAQGGAGDKLEYVQIMTTGNGIDFGDMSVSKERTSGCSNGHGGL